MKRDVINQALFTGATIFNSGTSEGAEKGWETKHGAAPEFTSKEHAENIHQMLSDLQKNGLAKPANLEKLARAKAYLGIGDAAPKSLSPEEEATIGRTQGALDSFHRTELLPRIQSTSPKNPIDRAKAKSQLLYLTSVHEQAKEISQDKTLSPKEREEQVKGLLMHGRTLYNSNPSVWPNIFLSNKKMSESLTKANAVRKGATALDNLKEGAPPMGFTGSLHPLSDDAETATKTAITTDDAESHHVAAAAHTKAAGKMSAFLKEASGGKHPNRERQVNGLTSTHAHHMARAEAHRNRAAYLDNEATKETVEKTLTKAKKSVKK